MTTTALPEDMNAEARRQSWFEHEFTGPQASEWGYGSELFDIIHCSFDLIDRVFGKQKAAPHLCALLGSDAEGDTWEERLESTTPGPPRDPDTGDLEWAGAQLINNAGLYGVYGVTARDVPFESRSAWVDNLAEEIAEFLRLAQPDPNWSISWIGNLALSRHAIDRGTGEVDLQSLAILGGVSEGRIRNLLSSGDSGLEKTGQNVTAASAAAWLRGRKDYFASIWQQPDEAAPEAPSPDFEDDVVFVPIAADGSHFHPGLLRAGKFKVGPKNAEEDFATFDEALAALQKMATPRWRRPNPVGNWGIVSGRDWKRVERRHLMSM